MSSGRSPAMDSGRFLMILFVAAAGTLPSFGQTTGSTSTSTSASGTVKVTTAGKAVITNIVEEFPLENGRVIKKTQIIRGNNVKGITETVEIVRSTSSVNATTFQLPAEYRAPEAHFTSLLPDHSTLQLNLGSGFGSLSGAGSGILNNIQVEANPTDFNFKSISDDFFGFGGDASFKPAAQVDERINTVKRQVDDVFKTGFFAADKQFDNSLFSMERKLRRADEKLSQVGFDFYF